MAGKRPTATPRIPKNIGLLRAPTDVRALAAAHAAQQKPKTTVDKRKLQHG